MKRLADEQRPFALSFYDRFPAFNGSYEELKMHAGRRLAVLRRLEAKQPAVHNAVSFQEDLLEHACLRLACSRSAWATVFFVNCEAQLLKVRLSAMPGGVARFFEDLVWPHLTVEAEAPHIIGPGALYRPQHANLCAVAGLRQIHFSRCSELLARREYPLSGGYLDASFPAVRQACAVATFRDFISAQMDALCTRLLRNPDDRIERLHADLFSARLAPVRSDAGALTRRHLFPLCIRGILMRLESNGHLMYDDRQTLYRFLRDVGVVFEDALAFIRSQFKCTAGVFEKEYAYALRHAYGLEGRRANYRSFSCNKIIGDSNNPNAVGCPFVNNPDFVRAHADIEDFGRDARAGCCAVGTAAAGRSLAGVFTSPSEYFRLVSAANDAAPSDEQ